MLWAELKSTDGSVVSQCDQGRTLNCTVRKRLGSGARLPLSRSPGSGCHWLCECELGHSGGFIPLGSEFSHQPQQGWGVGLLRLCSQAVPETTRESWTPGVL